MIDVRADDGHYLGTLDMEFPSNVPHVSVARIRPFSAAWRDEPLPPSPTDIVTFTRANYFDGASVHSCLCARAGEDVSDLSRFYAVGATELTVYGQNVAYMEAMYRLLMLVRFHGCRVRRAD